LVVCATLMAVGGAIAWSTIRSDTLRT
jgi:hypothetical protein